MTVSRDKIIKQAQEIADDGCGNMPCDLCALYGKICHGESFVANLYDSRAIAYAFLAGISFEKGLI